MKNKKKVKQKKCNHFTEFGEKMIFVNKFRCEVMCELCGEVLIYRR